MLKPSLINFSTSSKLLNKVINKLKVNHKNDNKDKIKSLFIFFILKKFTGADYFIFNTEKTFNIL